MWYVLLFCWNKQNLTIYPQSTQVLNATLRLPDYDLM